MRKYVVLVCILALIMMGIPAQGTNAAAKLGPALSDYSLLDPIHMDSEMLPVHITLMTPGVISQITQGGSFSTNTNELNSPNNMTRVAALSSVLNEQKLAVEKILSIEGVEVLNTYQLTSNAVRAIVPRSKIMEVAELGIIKYVWYDAPQYLQRWHSRTPLNCWPVYNQETDLDGDVCLDPKGRPVDGTGTVCAITDTGLDYTHPDFGSQARPEGNKVVISHDFADSDDDCQEDGHSHGTACGGIVAADGEGEEKGIAPKAKLAGYKFGGPGGRLTGDAGATWEMLVKEEIDVNNNSWGRTGGWTQFRVMENNAVAAGVSIVASQGNNGSPGPNLPIPCGSTSSPENVIGVGATMDYAMFSQAVITDAPDIDIIGKGYKGIWSPVKKDFTDFGRPLQIVDCGWGRAEDFEGLDLEGKIALIWRGPSPEYQDQFGSGVFFSTKLINAANAGAIAVFLYNHSNGFLSLTWNNFAQNTTSEQQDAFLPCFELLQSQGLELREMLHSGNEWEIGSVDENQNDVYVKVSKPEGYGNVTSFTSQGPTQYSSLKPDVCAPGDNIRTTAPRWQWGSRGIDDKWTNNFGGTSAAGPFVAGIACLVRQARPEWDAFEVKRAIMNTSNPLKRYIDDNYVPLLSQGMGRADAFEACMTDILIQPPSAMIVANDHFIHMDDPPAEWEDRAKKAKLPSEIKKSMIAFKLYNYSAENSHDLEMSYEVNSRQADEIKVEFTKKSVSVGIGEIDEPGIAWVGIDVEWPVRLTGGTNDILIWFTDKKTGQRWHTGITIYNNIPSVQGARHSYASFITYPGLDNPPTITPNGDGIDDGFDAQYTLTNGSFNVWIQRQGGLGYYNNYMDGAAFWIKDYNEKSWQLIHTESVLELGEHSLSWDGLGENGEFLLPDGEWYLGMTAFDKDADFSRGMIVPLAREVVFFNDPFQVQDSVVAPLPLVSAYPIPSTPGKGSEFELGIYIQHATNVKSIQFDIVLPGLSDVATYMGYRKGDFMFRDSSYSTNDASGSMYEPLFEVTDPEDGDKITVNIQRPHDGVSGEGWLAYIKLLPIASNYLDVAFENLNISYINEETMAEEYKFAFYKSASITIDREYYDPEDFNHDGEINEDDLDILTAALGSARGESRYKWRCDLDFNGIIDMNDMVIFAQAFEE